jgi:poly(A) polymerase
MVAQLCDRLRTSRALSAHLQGLTQHHLHLGFLVHEAPLPRRRVHEYLRATEPVAADVTLLTVADRLSARGSGPFATDQAVEAHLELARQMIGAALDWRRDGPPRPLLRGDELVAELDVPQGPELGDLLDELEAAQYAGEVSTREQALDLLRGIRG